jgi:hypothetical protein
MSLPRLKVPRLVTYRANPDAATAIRRDRPVIGTSYDTVIGMRNESMPMKCIDQMRSRRGARRHAASRQKWRARRAQRCVLSQVVTHHGCQNAAVAFTVPTLVQASMRESDDVPATRDEPPCAPVGAQRILPRRPGQIGTAKVLIFTHAAFNRKSTWMVS